MSLGMNEFSPAEAGLNFYLEFTGLMCYNQKAF